LVKVLAHYANLLPCWSNQFSSPFVLATLN